MKEHNIIVHVAWGDVVEPVLFVFDRADAELVARVRSRVEQHNAGVGDVTDFKRSFISYSGADIWVHHGAGRVGVMVIDRDGSNHITQVVIDATKIINDIVNVDRIERGAAVQHEETRSMKREAPAYYDAHRDEFGSRIACAKYIAGHIVPVAVRTINESWLKGRK